MFAPDFTICQTKCDELKFTDITGDYDATTNPGGWGAPNPARIDVTSSYLYIEDENGVIYTIDLTSYVIVGTTEVCITSVMAGVSGEFADGIYKITWSISTAAGSIQECKEIFLYCQVSCKVDKLIAGLSSSSCNCKCDTGTKTDNALLAFILLKGLKSAACCYKTTKFKDLLSAINSLSEINCKNC